MRLTKFQRRKEALLEKQRAEIQALEEQERREREKLVEPVVEKLSKVAAEVARAALEKDPDILESYSFRKRVAARVLAKAVDEIFSDTEKGEDKAEPKEAKPADVRASEGDEKSGMIAGSKTPEGDGEPDEKPAEGARSRTIFGGARGAEKTGT